MLHTTNTGLIARTDSPCFQETHGPLGPGFAGSCLPAEEVEVPIGSDLPYAGALPDGAAQDWWKTP